MKLLKLLKTILGRRFRKSSVANVAIVSDGGVGDCLCYLNYAKHLQLYCQDNIEIDFYTRINHPEYLYNSSDNYIRNFFHKSNIKHKLEKYDLVLWMQERFPKVRYVDTSRLIKLNNSKLIEICKLYNGHYNKFKFFYDNSPKSDGYSAVLSLLIEKNRVSQPDICGLLHIKDFKINIPTANDEEILKKFLLFGRKYVTINRSVDSNKKQWESTKLWPRNYNTDLMKRLVSRYSNISVVYIGPKTEDWLPQGIINLSGKTTFEELKVLIKHANIHIGPEGGMIHMRHILCTKPSIVLFGSTSSEFYGYSENYNISADDVCDSCEWMTENWNEHCLRDNGCSCKKLESIHPNNVLEILNKII